MTSKTITTLAKQILKNQAALKDWFAQHAEKAPPPFYCSIDLRDSGDKIVPVDSNLYPGGFNNICPEDLRTAPSIFRRQVERLMSQRGHAQIKKILILPESHTHNANYIENLYFLRQLIQNAGYETQIGWYGSPTAGLDGNGSSTSETGAIQLVSSSGKELEAHPIRINNNIISIPNFTPDLILLNNDFSSGYPALLDPISQPILPSHTLGWHSRKKSEHFRYYNELAEEFAQLAEIDPWIIKIDTEEVSPVNFNESLGTEEVAQAVERVLERTRQAYEVRKVDRKPFVFVKNNAGTYGMGIMVAHSADDLRKMNRRTKNKMSRGKNHSQIESVVVQEGVPTATLVNRLAAEPVIYLFGCELIGGFLRTHPEKGNEDNLNSPGVVFRKLCMSDLREIDRSHTEGEISGEADLKAQDPIRELVYGSVARISVLASGIEMTKHARENN